MLNDKVSIFATTSLRKGAELNPQKSGRREKATSPLRVTDGYRAPGTRECVILGRTAQQEKIKMSKKMQEKNLYAGNTMRAKKVRIHMCQKAPCPVWED